MALQLLHATATEPADTESMLRCILRVLKDELRFRPELEDATLFVTVMDGDSIPTRAVFQIEGWTQPVRCELSHYNERGRTAVYEAKWA